MCYVPKSDTLAVHGRWLKHAPIAMAVFVDKVYQLCELNYEKGGDVVVECMTPDEIISTFESLEQVKEHCGTRLEAALNCRLGSDEDSELQRLEEHDDWKGDLSY